MTVPPETILGAIRASNYLRRSPWLIGGPRGHKEWLHFCVAAGPIDLLINGSVVDDLRPGLSTPHELGRLSILVHDDAGWRGGVELHGPEATRVIGGELDVSFGPSRIWLAGDAIRIRLRHRRPAVEADLCLEPQTLPYLVTNVRGMQGRPLNWALIPRSRATGAIRVGDQVHECQGSLAYHDHNWGSFGWGYNFAWEWGYGLPADPANPWSTVFTRLSSRGNTAALMQLLLVWRGDRLLRTFRDHDLEVRREGFLRPDHVVKLPPAMGLVSPGVATDVPRRLILRAASRGDRITAVFTTAEVAQLIIPNDDDLGVTIINEVSGRLTVEGTALGEPFQIENRAVFEFLGG